MTNLLKHTCFTLPMDIIYLQQDNINISFLNNEWMLEICLNRDNEDIPFAESFIYLCKDTPTTGKVYVNSKTFILLYTGTEKEAVEIQSCFNPEISSNNIWNAPTAVFKDYVSSLGHNRSFLKIELWFHGMEAQNGLIDELYGDLLACTDKIESGLEYLAADFNEVLNDEFNADVVLQVGDVKLRAHKLVLCARSGVFKAMFRHDMSESKTNTVHIEDFDGYTVEMFLKYLYTGKFPQTTIDAIYGLYSIADKYAVSALKRKCTLVFLGGLASDNACQILKLAYSHSDSKLKDVASDFIAENAEILCTEEWKSISDETPRLAIEVYRLFVDKMAQLKCLRLPVGINVGKKMSVKPGNFTREKCLNN